MEVDNYPLPTKSLRNRNLAVATKVAQTSIRTIAVLKINTPYRRFKYYTKLTCGFAAVANEGV